jgi:hypothetical protein
MQFTFLVVIPTTNASIASFWLRLGRNLYENPGNSAYRSRSSLPPPFDDLVLKCGDSEPALPTTRFDMYRRCDGSPPICSRWSRAFEYETPTS